MIAAFAGLGVIPTRVGMVQSRKAIRHVLERDPHARGDGPDSETTPLTATA